MHSLICTFAVILVAGIKSAPLKDYQQEYRQDSEVSDNNRQPPESPQHDFVKIMINKQNLYQNASVDVVGRDNPRNPPKDVRPNSRSQGVRNCFDLNRGVVSANGNIERGQHQQFVVTDKRSLQGGQQNNYRELKQTQQHFNPRKPYSAHYSQEIPGVEASVKQGNHENNGTERDIDYRGEDAATNKYKPHNASSTQVNNDVQHKYNHTQEESLNKDTAFNQGTSNNQRGQKKSQLNSATNNQHYEGNNQKMPIEIEHKENSQNKKPEPEEFLNSDPTDNQQRPDQNTSQKDDAFNYQNASPTLVNNDNKYKKPIETTRRHHSNLSKYEKEQLWGEAEADITTENVIISDRSDFVASECPPGEHKINARCVSED